MGNNLVYRTDFVTAPPFFLFLPRMEAKRSDHLQGTYFLLGSAQILAKVLGKNYCDEKMVY